MAPRRFAYTVEIAAAKATGQDRAGVFERPGGLAIALADGAGGTGNGALAAQAVIDGVGAAAADTDWIALITALDREGARRGHGETTAVILSVDALGIRGASVGDSGAWLVGDEIRDLTEGQVRKPLVGSGCVPLAFRTGPIGDRTLVVASDGLLRYAKQPDIARIVRQPDLASAGRQLVELVRLPSGTLQDDVSVVLCRTVGS